MIIVRIDGGLGNQMFQYAYARYLAQQHGSQLWLDTSAYAAQPQHGYLLDRFSVTAPEIGNEQRTRVPRRYRPTQAFKFRELVPGHVLRRHKEKPFGFHPRHLQVADQRYLVGYWQSEKFFPGMRTQLLREFALAQPLSDTSRRLAERMGSTPSVAVHVRRGDYVTLSDAAKIYVHLELEYYRQAISRWAARHEAAEVFLFSNDISWCRKHFDLPWPTTFVDHNTAATAHEDLELMRQAQCCVIANSTFSWWAAWLNERRDKTVYAPTQWFHANTLDGTHIVPDDWLSVSPAGAQPASIDMQVRAA